MAYINVDEIYILDNTGLQVDMATDIPFADAGFTDAQKEQARANIGAGGTNPNLLDNPFFQVNQRGQTTYAVTEQMTVDRWKVGRNTLSVTVQADGVKLTRTSTSYNPWFQQTFENAVPQGTYTMSILYRTSVTANKDVYKFNPSNEFIPNSNDWAIFASTFSVANDTTTTFSVQDLAASLSAATIGDYIEIKAIKLEVGSVSTLANDTPPDYDRELEHCKYYFERIKALGNYAEFGLGIAQTTGTVYAHIPMHPKRDGNYTIATNGSFRVISTSGISATGISKYAHTSTAGNLVVSVTASVTAGQAYRLTANNDANAYIDINNDL